MGLLVTSTLLDNFDWMQKCPASYRAQAILDFTNLIRRKSVFEPTPAVARGMAFERLICDHIYDENFDGVCTQQFLRDASEMGDVVSQQQLDEALKVARFMRAAVDDGEQQVKLKTTLNVDSETVTLFGIADVIHYREAAASYIVDIKTTNKYKGAKKYLDRSQHLVYCLATQFRRFVYAIANWGETSVPVSFEVVDIKDVDLDKCHDELVARVQKVYAYLRATRLWEDYVRIFSKNG